MDKKTIDTENDLLDLEMAQERLDERKRMRKQKKLLAVLMRDYGLIEMEALMVLAHTGIKGCLQQIAEDLKISHSYSRQLACRPHVKAAIKKHLGLTEEEQLARIEGSIATRQDLQEFWTEMIKDPKSTEGSKLKAAELLAKSEIMLVDKTIHEGGKAPIKLAVSKPSLKDRIASLLGKDDDDFLQ